MVSTFAVLETSPLPRGTLFMAGGARTLDHVDELATHTLASGLLIAVVPRLDQFFSPLEQPSAAFDQ